VALHQSGSSPPTLPAGSQPHPEKPGPAIMIGNLKVYDVSKAMLNPGEKHIGFKIVIRNQTLYNVNPGLINHG
jgi:hypothetical protein